MLRPPSYEKAITERAKNQCAHLCTIDLEGKHAVGKKGRGRFTAQFILTDGEQVAAVNELFERLLNGDLSHKAMEAKKQALVAAAVAASSEPQS